jgi:hypothetical protein
MANNPNDALLYRLQQMSLNNGSSGFENYSTNSSVNRHSINNPPSSNYTQQQPIYQYLPDDAASGIYENVEYTSVIAQPLVTDLDEIDPQNFQSSNAKAQPQLKPSNGGKIPNYTQEQESLRYAHTPQPSELAEPSPIYENLQVISG